MRLYHLLFLFVLRDNDCLTGVRLLLGRPCDRGSLAPTGRLYFLDLIIGNDYGLGHRRPLPRGGGFAIFDLFLVKLIHRFLLLIRVLSFDSARPRRCLCRASGPATGAFRRGRLPTIRVRFRRTAISSY
ncbi:uncharacterized protein B0H18DRAFT_996277 [Fomitopsis serialis]|uniref:uncharacterized protein n=1 Tax=Fomitopsis serialis TaxID=139415 RepID=UPI0020075B85|nr:uncharacterized protein B0H18DRAFT_996277 [Neoantrodia serialis]KAH9929787.1 hypothetical protein B0H18DRAFT_996277 [Neoantrodia serialis]